MVFAANPLALSVSEAAFESWLRDGGYLEILDRRASELSRRAASASSSSAAAAASDADAGGGVVGGGLFVPPVFSWLWSLLSLLTVNPFAKLTAEDFSGETPSWTAAFIGPRDSYSFPSSPSQVRMRVQENVKRYARNYAALFILFFACSLYQMPLALVGLLSSLALWDAFRLGSDRWELHQYPAVNQVVVRIVQCATIVVLFFSNVQLALFYALGVSYAVLLIHAALRKLTPIKRSSRTKKIERGL